MSYTTVMILPSSIFTVWLAGSSSGKDLKSNLSFGFAFGGVFGNVFAFGFAVTDVLFPGNLAHSILLARSSISVIPTSIIA